jgi:hypothetical protein
MLFGLTASGMWILRGRDFYYYKCFISGAEGLAGCRDGTVSAAAGRHLRDSGDTEEGRHLVHVC